MGLTISVHSPCNCVLTLGRVEWHIKEGETFQPVKHVATVKGKARHLLLGERVALNILARCSGIATKCDPTTAPLRRDTGLPEIGQIEKDQRPRQRIRIHRYCCRDSKDHARWVPETREIAGRISTPITGFRLVEKYGMLVGGIDAHRHDLSSMIMLKDNHIWSAGAPRGHQTRWVAV